MKRIAYEFCEDSARQDIKYAEVRYSPHLFSDTVDDQDCATGSGSVTPRDAVVAINKGLAKGMKEFGVKVYSILCCMTHKPGECCIMVKYVHVQCSRGGFKGGLGGLGGSFEPLFSPQNSIFMGNYE